MEIRQLHYFLAVAEELNFSRAADRLKITQPPLSMQIQNLEQELGVPLFYRTNRRVELTEAGKMYEREVRKILEDLHRANENVQRAHRGEIGTLTIGFVGSATYDILPALLRDYRIAYPNVQVLLLEMSTPLQIESLRNRRIDVGVLRPPVADDTLSTEVVMSAPCVLAVPSNHLLVELESVTLADLTPHPFVMLSRQTWAGLYDEILALCNPTISQEALEFQTVIGLVAAGLGIAVVPQSAKNLHAQDVVYLELDNLLPEASMGISWRKEDRSPLVNAFVQMAKSKNAF